MAVLSVRAFGSLVEVVKAADTTGEDWGREPRGGGGKRAKKRRRRGGSDWASLTYCCEDMMIVELVVLLFWKLDRHRG